MLTLETSVENVYLVGSSYARRLEKLGITTVRDLLHHVPVRYIDFSLTVPIRSLQPGETITIQGKLDSIVNVHTKYGKVIQKAIVSDESGSIEVVWYNQRYLTGAIPVGSKISLAGTVDTFGPKFVIQSPDYELLERVRNGIKEEKKSIHTGRLVPIYRETSGVTSKWLRSRIASLLPHLASQLVDYLPSELCREYDLMPYQVAVSTVHFPVSLEIASRARRRLSLDELLELRLNAILRREEWKEEFRARPILVKPNKNALQTFFRSLPFSLTQAQKQAMREIAHDMGKNTPMNRLLEGDVGSGKTVVAAFAVYLTILNGYQTAYMVPTEILALQQYHTLDQLLTPLGVRVALKTGARRTKLEATCLPARQGSLKLEKKEPFDVVVGTHALLSDKLKFSKLALIVIDEQHRFGVEQRAILRKKGGTPHFLTMTATPIPRTIALTLYGDLDLSYLDELPSGRQKIRTWVVPPEKRERCYVWIKKQIQSAVGEKPQVFIVCPLIEESESETLASVKAAKGEFERLKKTVFPEFALGLLHGRLKPKEKEVVLEAFKKGGTNILVSTPVIEVGIDIPEAAIIIVEAAERFGLAQLHQLRGRVGRGEQESFCFLFTESQKEEVLSRLKYMERVHSGSKLAEFDLKRRGPGDLFGTRQHGILKLKIADLTDLKLLKESEELAHKLLARDKTLSNFPLLRERLDTYKIKAEVTN